MSCLMFGENEVWVHLVFPEEKEMQSRDLWTENVKEWEELKLWAFCRVMHKDPCQALAFTLKSLNNIWELCKVIEKLEA